MHKVARFLLLFALAEFAFCFVVTAVVWPWSIVTLGVFSALCSQRRRKSLWKHGTARWASESELKQAGMIGGFNGLSIGRLIGGGSQAWSSSITALWDARVADREACNRFILRCCQLLARTKGDVVRLAKAVHVAVFAPTGVGKGVSLIIPFLQESSESAVVLDFKGENAALTARHREERFEHRSVLLDPFQVVTSRPDSFNPLDFIDPDSPNWIDDCRDLAEQLVVRTGEEREQHWNDAAEMWIGAAILATVRYAEPGNRSLQTVRDVLSNPDKIPKLIKLLCQEEGLLARWGGQLAHFRDKELSSTLTTANRHLRFLDTSAIAGNTTSSSFDPRELSNGKLTVYCILPPEHMRAQAALIRMWIGSLMRAVVQGGLRQQNIHVVLDEAVSLGPNLSCLNDAIDKYRGYGIRLQLYYQSPAQLKKCFPQEQDQTVLANCTQVYFGVNDASAETLSARLGDQTIVVESGGSGSSDSSQSSHAGSMHHSSSHSASRNDNWSQMARRLLKPDEILSLNERCAITLVPGMRPILTQLERYYEKPGNRTAELSGSAALTLAFYLVVVLTNCVLVACQLMQGVQHG